MVLVLPAVVPWAFQNAKALQSIDQKAGEARCSLANALGPSFLGHLKNRDRMSKLCTNTWVQKGIDGLYFITGLGTWFMDTLLR